MFYQDQSSNYMFKYCREIYIYTGVFLHLSVSYLTQGHRDITTDGDSYEMGCTFLQSLPERTVPAMGCPSACFNEQSYWHATVPMHLHTVL